MNRELQILTITNRLLVIGSQCVNWHPEDLNLTKGDTSQLISPETDEKIWWKCSYADLTSVWDLLTFSLSKGVLKRYFLESGVTKSLTVCNIRSTLAMTIIFFFRTIKIWWIFKKRNKNLKKRLLYLRKYRLNRERQILTISNRILVIGSQCVN